MRTPAGTIAGGRLRHLVSFVDEYLMIILDPTQLLPAAWSSDPAGECYFFNPAIVRFRDELLLAYRVVKPDGRRRLAICRLTEDLRVLPGSAAPLSDSIREGGAWHADPRFCVYRDRLYLHYNDGISQKPNHIYLFELDPDTLEARGAARQLTLDGPRRPVEKNWMLFEHDDRLLAVYSICPHIVLEVELGEGTGPVTCRRAYREDWDVSPYADRFGQPRGGAPPVRLGDQYVSFFHSFHRVHRLRRLLFRLLRRQPDQVIRYVGGVYGFAAYPPFAPLWLRPAPLLEPPSLPHLHHAPLASHFERVVYHCGAILSDGRWIVSVGLDHEYCCLVTFELDAVPGQSAICAKARAAGSSIG